MDQVLSQQEIDMLLSAMNNGEIIEEVVEEKADEQIKAKKYDFRRPIKLSKEYINTLHMIFEDYAKMASTALSTKLRTNAMMQVAAIEQISYDEFIHSIPKFTLLGVMQSKPMNGLQILEINPQLSTLFIELLCGGLDVILTRKEKDESIFEDLDKKSFTDIELSILTEIVELLINTFQISWREIVELDCTLESLDTNPQLLQSMSPNEPITLITFNFKMFEVDSFVNLCIPYVFFEGMIDKLSIRNWFDANRNENEDDSESLQKSLNNVELEMEVQLGNAHMNLSEFLQLMPGDIIKLDRKITDPLDSYIAGKPYYRVKPGKKDDYLAVELIDQLEGED